MESSLLLKNGVVVLENTLAEVDVLIEEDWISALIPRTPGSGYGAKTPLDSRRELDISRCYLCPGFIDIHVHGGGGGDFSDGDFDSVKKAARFHLSHGTTGVLATLPAAPLEGMLKQVKFLRRIIEEPGSPILGIHLEGPYLNPDLSGALPAESFRQPSLREAAMLMDAAGPALKMITIAPELEGALEVIRFFASRGVKVAAGHSGSTWTQMQSAFEAGLSHGTHFGNRMGQMHQREPGITGSLLAKLGVTIDIIADGAHLHPGFINTALVSKGLSQIVLISDALSTAGLPDGEYRSLGREVKVKGGRVILKEGSSGSPAREKETLAGGCGAVLDGLRNMIRWFNLSLPDAVRMASLNPARLLGLAGKGIIKEGACADLVVLDQGLQISHIIAAGEIMAGGLNIVRRG